MGGRAGEAIGTSRRLGGRGDWEDEAPAVNMLEVCYQN